MPSFHPYLNFPGTAEAAFKLYCSIFGGEIRMALRFSDVPQGANLNEEDKSKMMHIAMPLGKDTMLMATDALESMGHKYEPGNNFYLTVYADSREQADEFFAALSQGGDVELAMNNTFWGDYFGMCKDPFGTRWMVSFHAVPTT